MGKRKDRRPVKHTPATRPRRWPWAIVAVGIVAAGGLAGWWWSAGSVAGGTPRLVLDRDVVDIGYVRFETPARAVFTVSNAGDGPLVLPARPEVQLVKGC